MKAKNYWRLALTVLPATAETTVGADGAAVPSTPEAYFPSKYAWVELGGAFADDFNAQLGLPISGAPPPQDLSVSLTPGFAAMAAFGERFGRWVSVEFQGGYLYYNVDEVSSSGTNLGPFDGNLSQVPLFLNLAFNPPVSRRFEPFVGLGAGVVISRFDTSYNLLYPDGTVVPVDDSSTEYTFAYQLFGGVRYALSEGGSLGLTYRFTGAGSPTWGLEQAGTGSTVANLKADDIFVHSVTLSFTLAF